MSKKLRKSAGLDNDVSRLRRLVVSSSKQQAIVTDAPAKQVDAMTAQEWSMILGLKTA